MADQVIKCSECGVKLKSKNDRPLPQETPCPKCGAALFQKKSAATTRSAKPARRPIKEDINEFDDDEFENEAPRKKSRKRSRRSAGMPVGLIAGLGGALVEMKFTDTTAIAGQKHTYRIISVNTAGLKSVPDS